MDARILKQVQASRNASRQDIANGLVETIVQIGGDPLTVRRAKDDLSAVLWKARNGIPQLIGNLKKDRRHDGGDLPEGSCRTRYLQGRERPSGRLSMLSASNRIFLGGHDDGVAGNDGSDLFEATKTAIALERSFGMGEKRASYGDLSRRRLEEIGHLDPELMARVDRILQEQLDRAKGILERHRSACMMIADELVARLELPGKEVLDALDQHSRGRDESAIRLDFGPRAR